MLSSHASCLSMYYILSSNFFHCFSVVVAILHISFFFRLENATNLAFAFYITSNNKNTADFTFIMSNDGFRQMPNFDATKEKTKDESVVEKKCRLIEEK
jgi:hypothetical protein